MNLEKLFLSGFCFWERHPILGAEGWLQDAGSKRRETDDPSKWLFKSVLWSAAA
jgi:hypothetical protein